MHHRTLLRLLCATSFVLGGCGAIIGTRDLEYDPAVGPGGNDGAPTDGTTTDGTTTDDGSVDGGGDGSCNADLTKDPKNCGRCGHDCLGGECKASKCEAVRLGALADTPFGYIAVTSKYVFAATRIALTTEKGGIFRFSKTAGVAPELYVDIRYAEAMAVLGDRIYFVVEDNPYDGIGAFGGFYSCPIDGPAPCTPTRHFVADNPRAITASGGKVYFSDSAGGSGIQEFTPPNTVSLFRIDYNPPNLYVDGTAAFYTVSVGLANADVKLIEIFPDAGYTERSVLLSGPAAEEGEFFGTPSYLLGIAYDGTGAQTRGVVRRYPRVGTVSACDFAANTNKRSYGVWADEKRVYWTNEGEGNDHPYTNGSLASCDVTGCCTTADTLWTGTEPRAVTGDDAALYWVTRTAGEVWKIAKP